MASEPTDFTSPGFERLLEGERGIPIVAPTIVAFLGRTERGPLDQAVAIRDFDSFRRVFGGHCAYSFVSFAVQHFFTQGGQEAVVVRVANRATRARLVLPAGDETLRLEARDPGSREYLRASVDYDGLGDDAARFNLIVQRVGRPGSQLVVDQEIFAALSLEPSSDRYAAAVLAGSALVQVVGTLPWQRPDATRPAYPGAPIPYVDAATHGTDGDDLTDYDVIGSRDAGTGLFALDVCDDIDLLCIPAPPGRDLGTTSFVAATRYCERRRALLVWDPPWAWNSVDTALLGARGGNLVSHNAVSYFPRLRSRIEPGRYPNGLPACGALAGVLARTDAGGVWRSLACDDPWLRGHLVPLVELGDRQARMLQRAGVNTVTRAGGGAVLTGDVTFTGPSAVASLWQRLGCKRLTSFILRSIERHTRWVFAEPASEELATVLDRQVWIFFARLRQRGALAGTSAEQAFFVRVTARAPTAEDAAGNRVGGHAPLTLRVGFAPQRPNEFLVFDFRYDPHATATAAVPVLDADRYVG